MLRAAAVPLLIVTCLLRPLAAQDAAPATVTLSGRVVNWQGQPIAGAGVAWAAREALTTAQLLAEPPVRTGADGTFTLTVPQAPESDELAPPALQIAAKGMAAIAPSFAWKYRPPTPGTEIKLRENTDAGDFVLPEGARLFGRVRDIDGKGVAGVVVTMRDLLDGHRAFGGTSSNAHCRAVSNSSGIFELPGALANAAILDFAAKGFHRETLYCVGAGAPLEVALQPSGRIAGRVVDQKGGIVAGAIVRASYERSGTTTRVRTREDGSFELSIEQPGRFRVTASRPRPPTMTMAARRAPAETADSPVQSGPVANLELTLALPKAAADGALRVQAVEAASGKPVAGFRAIAIWQQYAMQNAAYLDYLATMWMPGMPVAEGNEALVKGPGENEGRTGAVRVVAPGFAPATERDVEWPENDTAAERKPIVVKLVPEATLAGRILDERTGAPIAGASVWVMRKQDRSQGSFGVGNEPPETAVVTGADGAFSLAQLGEGDWTLRWKHRDRPLPAPIDVTLAAEERKVGVDLKLAAGARVAGRITGLAIQPGTKVFLQPIAAPRFANYQTFSSVSTPPSEGKVPVAADGSFSFSGIALASFYLVAELPSPPRGGAALCVPIEPLRVRAEGVQRDFDIGQDLPGRIRGTVKFPKAEPIGSTLIVVAEQVSDNADEQSFRSYGQFQGPRAFVEADGSFAMPVVRGTHTLRVFDAASGVLLATATDRTVVAAGGEAVRELKVPLTEVVVKLEPDATAGPFVWMDRLEVRHIPAKCDANGGVMIGGNDEYDTGIGLPVAVGVTSLKLWLPEGKATLLARGSAASLRRGQGPAIGALAKEEMEFAADEKASREVVIKVGPPPELDAPAPKADAAAVQKKQ